ncbi:MAG TPA: isoprenylcysteine carboxylmethyltransferase family protein [Hyphomicrobium sp.]|jgi:protein-S-isoprenylcysteine O-methyltransferase Ste14
MAATQDSDVLARRLIVHTVIWLMILGTILFLSAGTLDWPEAWVLLIGSGGLGLVSALIIARHDPQLIRERMRGPIQSKQKPWDKVLLAVVMMLCIAMFVVAGLDAVRYRTSNMPLWLEVLGAAGIALGIYIFHIVMRTNSYATAVVRIQDERGHQVISTGPYAFVRHPMYSGAILYFLGIALLLGSWYAVAIAVVLVALFGLRAVWEEQTLIDELPGYATYAQRVRYRLIPSIW